MCIDGCVFNEILMILVDINELNEQSALREEYNSLLYQVTLSQAL